MIKFEPSPKTTRKNWTWSTRRKKQKNQDIKKLKFYWINGGHQCGNCRGFHWHIRSSKNVYRSMECKCHCHLRWSMFMRESVCLTVCSNNNNHVYLVHMDVLCILSILFHYSYIIRLSLSLKL